MQKVITLQKRIMRIIAGSSYSAHTDPLFTHYRVLKLDQIKQKQINEFMHHYIFKTLPKKYNNLFTFTADVHSYNIRNPSLIRTVLHALTPVDTRLESQVLQLGMHYLKRSA